ncbi:MAG TPA: Rossmann-like and DUF2520 domain-containing protein [Pyrinomonadaceae bacterium]|nr:Rossmann-like and DUF2520 domain-containing protein [Pyrinomonadaceae bacterium]
MTDRKRKQKPEVSIVGSGRLGTTLGVALLHRGYPVKSLVARRLQNARKAARLLDGEVEVLAAKELSSVRPTDVILITVPDDQIAGVAAELSRIDIADSRAPTVFHTSGALSADVLKPLQEKGWHTGSIHPLVSVSHVGVAIEGAFWSVEGDKSAVRLGQTIVRDLGGHSFFIRSEDKPLYHAAAVMVSGNVVALFDVALEMLAECGIKRETAQNILLPLIASTVRNLETKTPAESLTGTFSRGDLETVKRHLAALKRNPDALELYRLLGKRSLKLVRKHPQITQILDSV